MQLKSVSSEIDDEGTNKLHGQLTPSIHISEVKLQRTSYSSPDDLKHDNSERQTERPCCGWLVLQLVKFCSLLLSLHFASFLTPHEEPADVVFNASVGGAQSATSTTLGRGSSARLPDLNCAESFLTRLFKAEFLVMPFRSCSFRIDCSRRQMRTRAKRHCSMTCSAARCRSCCSWRWCSISCSRATEPPRESASLLDSCTDTWCHDASSLFIVSTSSVDAEQHWRHSATVASASRSEARKLLSSLRSWVSSSPSPWRSS